VRLIGDVFFGELGHQFVHVVGGADFEEVVDDGVGDFVGDDADRGIAGREVDGVFGEGIVGEVVDTPVVFLPVDAGDGGAVLEDADGDGQVVGEHVEHDLDLFDNDVEFGEHLFLDGGRVFLVDHRRELAGQGQVVVELVQVFDRVVDQSVDVAAAIGCRGGIGQQQADEAGEQQTAESAGGAGGYRGGPLSHARW
jgi:hypothetical protein